MNDLTKAITKPHRKIELSHIDLCAIKIASDRYLSPDDPEDKSLVRKVAIKWEAYKIAVGLHGVGVKLETTLELSMLEINLMKWALDEQARKYKRNLIAFHNGSYEPRPEEGTPFPEVQKRRIINTLKVIQNLS